jgi:hypothetical protein
MQFTPILTNVPDPSSGPATKASEGVPSEKSPTSSYGYQESPYQPMMELISDALSPSSEPEKDDPMNE